MPEKLLVISPYPSKKGVYDNQYSALASFAKNTLDSIINQKKSLRIKVLADRIPLGKNWQNKNINVVRVWSRNNIFTFLPLIREIIKNMSYGKILIELEWGIFGRNPFILALWPLFLVCLKLMRKKIFIVMHGIAVDFLKLSPQLGLNKKGFKTALYDTGIKYFYRSIISLSDEIIVLEKYFADLINLYFRTDKARFIPHGVDSKITKITKSKARKKLGLDNKSFLIINFGFINWYKGSDIIVDIFQKYVTRTNLRNNKIQLVIAGGVSNIHFRDRYYKKFTEKILEKVAVTPEIKLTGYLSEADIGVYFAASDLVILPYRLFISSSGPLSFALSYKKPFLLSRQLSGYFQSPDFREGLIKTKLKNEDLIFDPNILDFDKKLKNIRKKINKAKILSTYLYNQRKWSKIAPLYISLLKLNE